MTDFVPVEISNGKMVFTIILNIDYRLRRFHWNDQIGFSGSQPFSKNISETFDYIYDLLKKKGFGDIIFNVENEEYK